MGDLAPPPWLRDAASLEYSDNPAQHVRRRFFLRGYDYPVFAKDPSLSAEHGGGRGANNHRDIASLARAFEDIQRVPGRNPFAPLAHVDDDEIGLSACDEARDAAQVVAGAGLPSVALDTVF